MIEFLRNIDSSILLWVNTVARHPWADAFSFSSRLAQATGRRDCGRECLLLIGFRYFHLQIWRLILALALAIAITDLICYRVVKKLVERPRPFQSEGLKQSVQQLAEASGNSFPSNHAANCFAAALILGWYFPRARYLFYSLAALVGYSRIYLGVHYPSDVLFGALLGLIVAKVVSKFAFIQCKGWSRTST